VHEIVLVAGEPPDRIWFDSLVEQLPGIRIDCEVDAAFGYLAEIRLKSREVRMRVARVMERRLDEPGVGSRLVWVHNPGLARNLPMSAALARVCADRGVRVLWHHHDWWFDNRWSRWREIRASGFRTLPAATRATVPALSRGAHVAINRPDVARLRAGFQDHVAWLPNILEPVVRPSASATAHARAWLERRQNLPRDNAFWLVPCRFLRRKNILESVLLARWLRPEGFLITTGGPSSRDEIPTWKRLKAVAAKKGWRVRFSVLADAPVDAPSVGALMSASEALLLTSVQEGFGLPFLEAAAARKPLLGRRLAQVIPDLEKLGFRFPHLYDEIWVAPESLDWATEVRRQRRHFEAWRGLLPRMARSRVRPPDWLDLKVPGAVPFGRLTVTGQLEVLASPVDRTREAASERNVWLRPWMRMSAEGRLQRIEASRKAFERLSGAAYARRFWRIASGSRGHASTTPTTPTTRGEPERVLEAFLDETLSERHGYPMLWSPET